jgi:hypothetical protein
MPSPHGVCVVSARKSIEGKKCAPIIFLLVVQRENKTWPLLKLTALLMPGTAKWKKNLIPFP